MPLCFFSAGFYQATVPLSLMPPLRPVSSMQPQVFHHEQKITIRKSSSSHTSTLLQICPQSTFALWNAFSTSPLPPLLTSCSFEAQRCNWTETCYQYLGDRNSAVINFRTQDVHKQESLLFSVQVSFTSFASIFKSTFPLRIWFKCFFFRGESLTHRYPEYSVITHRISVSRCWHKPKCERGQMSDGERSKKKRLPVFLSFKKMLSTIVGLFSFGHGIYGKIFLHSKQEQFIFLLYRVRDMIKA